MHYNMKKIFVTTALALIFGLTCSGNVMAQAAISLSDDAKKPTPNLLPTRFQMKYLCLAMTATIF